MNMEVVVTCMGTRHRSNTAWPVPGVAAELLQRALDADRLTHAYIFYGPPRSRQKETAHHFAKAVLCQSNDHRPCGQCSNCRKFETENHPDVIRVEPDGNNIKIQQIRDIKHSFSWKAMEADRKVFLIDQADAMTVEAANALLKLMEEPPAALLLILLVNNRMKLLPTVLSRCQQVPFSRLPVEETKRQLLEEGLEPDHARLLAFMTDSVTMAAEFSKQEKFAQIVALVIQLSEEIISKRAYPLFTIQEKVIKPGWIQSEAALFLDSLAWWFRDLAMIRTGSPDRLARIDQQAIMASQATSFPEETWVQMMDIVLQAKNRLQNNANLALTLESMVLRLQEELS